MSTESLEMAPTEEQLAGWRNAAGARPLGEWLTEVADAAALEHGIEPEPERQWPVVIKLKRPVVSGPGGVAINELVMRRGQVKDLKGLKLPTVKGSDFPLDLFITVASRLSGQTTQVIEAIDLDDSGAVMEVAQDFLGKAMGGARR